MSFKSFTQIVILGSASFVPFMQLTAGDRRAVIEDLLDIQIFSTMNNIIKLKFQDNKDSIERNRIELAGHESKRSFMEKTITSLRKVNSDKLTDYSNQINQYEQDVQTWGTEIDALNDKKDNLIAGIDLNKLKSKHLQLVRLKTGIKNNHQRTKDTIQFFHDTDNCPTCFQTINDTVKQTETSKLSKKIDELSDGLKKIDVQLDTAINNISDAEKKLEEYAEVNKQIEIKKTKISNNLSLIKDIKSRMTQLDNSDELLQDNLRSLDETNDIISDLENTKKTLLEDKLYIETAISMLKDGGIKTKIIKQYLPVINKQINKYLTDMGFFVNFNINENFEETIKSRYRDTFSYNNFSQGEKMRIDLAILFTWRTIAKLRNSVNCNILFFDEIFDSSLDSNGTDEFIKIVKNLTDGTNTFVISHKVDQMLEKFDKVHKVKKVRNYSVLETT